MINTKLKIEKQYQKENIPIRTIDFNKSSSERWVELVTEYKEPIKRGYQILDERIKNMIGTYPKWMVNMFTKYIVKLYGSWNHHYEELISIAKILELPLEKVIIAQYGYEFFSACTSTIVSNSELYQSPIHLRTMDWDDNTLRPLTIQLNIMKGDSLIGVATTWAGFIGFMTIVKPNVCSISVNYRRNDNILFNYPANLYGMLSGRLTISYLVREAVLGDYDNYADILNFMRNEPLSAPCYITMTGMLPDSGAVLVRDRNDCQTYYIDSLKGYIIQTNNDPNDMRQSRNDKMSIERRHVFHNHSYPAIIAHQSNQISQSSNVEKTYIDADKYTDLYLTYPVLKYNVVYFSIMSPGGYRLVTNPDEIIYNYSQQIYPSKDLPVLTKPSMKAFWEQYPVPEPPLYTKDSTKLLELVQDTVHEDTIPDETINDE